MKILVTGGTGQLAQEIKNLLPQAEYPTRADLDLSKPHSIHAYFKEHKFDLTLNCAAYTQVDAAEDNREECRAINTIAPEIIAAACPRVIHFSTDYIFNGLSHKPYLETDSPDPVNFYGETKLLGEENLLRANPQSMVIRTSWLYSQEFGKNFFKTIRRLTQEKNQLGIVIDQVGTPTHAGSLAEAVVKNLIPSHPKGVFHYSDEGVASWYDFAMEINRRYPTDCQIRPIQSSEYPTKARRPHYSVLSKQKIKETLGIEISHWQDRILST
jgi:dTDP-4-dehydrorhamnose reductase